MTRYQAAFPPSRAWRRAPNVPDCFPPASSAGFHAHSVRAAQPIGGGDLRVQRSRYHPRRRRSRARGPPRLRCPGRQRRLARRHGRRARGQRRRRRRSSLQPRVRPCHSDRRPLRDARRLRPPDHARCRRAARPGAGAAAARRIRQRALGPADRIALRRDARLRRRPARTTNRHAVLLVGRRSGRAAPHLRHDVGAQDHRPADLRRADRLELHRLPRRSARLPDAPRLPRRRIPDHGGRTAPRPVDVLDAEPHQVSAEDAADGGAEHGAGEHDAEAGVMTGAGIVVSVAIGAGLLLWVVNLIRRDRLYVGYGVIFVIGTLAALVVLLVPALLAAITRASDALLAMPALSIVPLALFTFLMVYVFAQITVLSNRVMRLTQELAIRNAREDG